MPGVRGFDFPPVFQTSARAHFALKALKASPILLPALASLFLSGIPLMQG